MVTTEQILNAMKQSAADGVSSTSFSAGSSSQSAMSIRDQIEAIRFLEERAAQDRNHGGITFRQIVPPGAVQ